MDAQHAFLVIDVDGRPEREIRYYRRIDIGETHGRMLGKDVAAAGLAPLSAALRGLLVRPDVFLAPGNCHRPGIPQRESIDRPR